MEIRTHGYGHGSTLRTTAVLGVPETVGPAHLPPRQISIFRFFVGLRPVDLTLQTTPQRAENTPFGGYF